MEKDIYTIVIPADFLPKEPVPANLPEGTELCIQCKNNAAGEWDECPYRSEIEGDHSLCNCCEQCCKSCEEEI